MGSRPTGPTSPRGVPTPPRRRAGAPPRRLVESFSDHARARGTSGGLAARFLRRARPSLRRSGRTLLRWIDVGEGAEAADLASYLLFDGQFALRADRARLPGRRRARRRPPSVRRRVSHQGVDIHRHAPRAGSLARHRRMQ